MRRVLIIDDELWSVRDLIVQMAVAGEWTVEAAIGPAEGLRYLRTVPRSYDLVIVDLEMQKHNPLVADDASGAEFTDGRIFCRQYRTLLDEKAGSVGLAANHSMVDHLGDEPGIDFVLDKSMPPDWNFELLKEVCEGPPS